MKILGTGSYLPENILSNDDLSKLVDTSDEWIVSRTGIRNRHITKNENTSDLATKAARAALENAGISVENVELIVVATTTSDSFVPGVSHKVLKNLQLSKAMAFDINAACTGFIYAMDVVTSLMQIRGFKYALVIGAEVLSKIIDWNDRNTCVLFGDGAGAVLLENNRKENQMMYVSCMATPDVDNVLSASGVTINNPLKRWSTQDNFYVQMKGQDVFRFAVQVACESVRKALTKTGVDAQEIDYYVLHQANSRILDYVVKKLRVPAEKFYSTIETTGNTSAASIPIMLDDMNKKGLLKKEMKVVLASFGAGLTYGAMLIEW